MAVVGDLYQIKDFQILDGNISNPILNVYFYKVVTADAGINASAVGNKFIDTLLAKVITVQASDILHTTVEVTNVNSLVDFATLSVDPGDGTGLRGVDYLPATNCWSFIYRRASLASRNGWKRIAGIDPVDQSDGAATGSIIGLLDTLGDFMDDGMVIGAGQLDPVIARRTPVVGGGVIYSAFPVFECSYVRIGTQNTRKR